MRPVIEKEGFKIRHIIYIVVIIICIVAIGIAVYMQFFRDEKLGVILGITNNEEEDNSEKENFLNIFDNTLTIVANYDGNVSKILKDEDIIINTNNTQEQTENYTLDIRIPYFNINSSVARELNNEIRDTFDAKSQSIRNSNDENSVIYNVKYKAYEYNNILSLIVLSELKEGNNSQRIIIQTYNYNLKENKLVTIDEILEQKQIDPSYANDKIKDEIDKSQEQNIKLSDLGYNTNIRDSNEDMYKIENVNEFFIGDNGKLYIVYAYGNSEYTSEMDIVIFE